MMGRDAEDASYVETGSASSRLASAATATATHLARMGSSSTRKLRGALPSSPPSKYRVGSNALRESSSRLPVDPAFSVVQEDAVNRGTTAGSTLPLRFRQTVSRMRSIRGLVSSPGASSPTRIDQQQSPTRSSVAGLLPSSGKGPVGGAPAVASGQNPIARQVSSAGRIRAVRGSSGAIPIATSSSLGPTYSRQSQTFQAMQSSLAERQRSGVPRPASAVSRYPNQSSGEDEGAGQHSRHESTVPDLLRQTSQWNHDEEESLQIPDQRAAQLKTFLELLRPLQSALSGLHQLTDKDDDAEEKEDEEADAQFRQHEREHSRVVRICCSLDNLLIALGDSVQQHKADIVAVAYGPAQELTKLLVHGLQQVAVSVLSTDAAEGDSLSTSTKEPQYLHDYLLEAADRLSRVTTLSSNVLHSTLQHTLAQNNKLQHQCQELRLLRDCLEKEMQDLRAFHADKAAANILLASSMVPTHDQGSSGPEMDDDNERGQSDNGEDESLRRLGLISGESTAAGTVTAAGDEVSLLRSQCQEYARLLEMAKQEIRLSHQEKQVLHARLVELSEATLKDREVAALRNDLYAEKARVKVLEKDNLRLTELHADLTSKFDSVVRNAVPTAATGSTIGGGTLKPGQESATMMADVLAGNLRHHTGQDDAVNDTSDDSTRPTTSKITPLPSAFNGVIRDVQLVPRHREEEKPVSPWITRLLQRKRVDNRQTKTTQGDGRGNNSDDGDLSDENEDVDAVRSFLRTLQSIETENSPGSGSTHTTGSASVRAVLRRQANVPTLSPVSLPLTKSSSSQGVVNSLPSASVDAVSATPPSRSPWILDVEIVEIVRAVIAALYQRYLLVDEAHRITQPQAFLSAASSSLPSFPAVAVLYFLERLGNENDAFSALRRFQRVAVELAVEYGDIRLFTEFLTKQSEMRTREQLHFLLAVLQAVDTVSIGISYDTPVTPTATTTTATASTSTPTRPGIARKSVMTGDKAWKHQRARLGRKICTLRALYITRVVFRALHAQTMRRKTPGGGKPSDSQCNVKAMAIKAVEVSSPPKQLAMRDHEPSANSLKTTSPQLQRDYGDDGGSVVDRAKHAFTAAVDQNRGSPLTLEMFNTVLMRFADPTSTDELHARMGPFYHISREEKQVPLDVFLVLLMSAFELQCQHRKQRMRALFISLVRTEREQEKMRAKELERLRLLESEAAAAAVNKRGGKLQTSGEAVKAAGASVKKKKRKKERRGRYIEQDADADLKGLSRNRLRDLLEQGGLLTPSQRTSVDAIHDDVDDVYVAVLEIADTSPTDIHFEQLYAALQSLHRIGQRVELSTYLCGMSDSIPLNDSSSAQGGKAGVDEGTNMSDRKRFQQAWRVMSRQSLALSLHDPNCYIRKHAQRLESLLVNDSEDQPVGATILAMRECVGLAWRLTVQRTAVPTDLDLQNPWRILTEFYFLNQAVAVVAGSDVHYSASPQSAMATAMECRVEGDTCAGNRGDSLRVFTDVACMHLQDILPATGVASTPPRQDLSRDALALEGVLRIHALVISRLFTSLSSARYNTGRGVTKQQCRQLLCRLPRDTTTATATSSNKTCPLLSIDTVDALFLTTVQAYTLSDPSTGEQFTLSRAAFTEFLVRAALAWHGQVARNRKSIDQNQHNQRLSSHLQSEGVAKIMARFCLESLAPLVSVSSCHRLQERSFQERLSCPLVMRALLEHRAFLRDLFYRSMETSSDRRTGNSMSLAAFVHFLRMFQLLVDAEPSQTTALRRTGLDKHHAAWYPQGLVLNEAGARTLFHSVRGLNYDDGRDDVMGLEFDEFAAAVAAIAALRYPHPFVFWHVQIDWFVAELHGKHAQDELLWPRPNL